MTDDLLKIRCTRCDHTYYVNLSELDRETLVLYKGAAGRRQYRTTCPECHTVNIVTVAFEEEDDGEAEGS